MKSILILLFIASVFSQCSNITSQKDEKPLHYGNYNNEDSFLVTGFYFIADINTGYKRVIKLSHNFNDTLFINPIPILTTKQIISAELATTYVGETGIQLKFDEKGKKAFAEATGKMFRKKLGFIIDNKLLMAPEVMSRIEGGEAEFSGGFTKEQMENFRNIIKAEMEE